DGAGRDPARRPYLLRPRPACEARAHAGPRGRGGHRGAARGGVGHRDVARCSPGRVTVAVGGPATRSGRDRSHVAFRFLPHTGSVIEARNLTKRYGETLAVDDLSFS